MQLLKQGAEAKLFTTNYLGQKAILKARERKKYREKSLDEKILRVRLRTECSLMVRAKKFGIRTPVVWKVDVNEAAIIMEFVEGKNLKEKLN